MELFDELKWRGMLKDISNIELAKQLLNKKGATFYCGFDPTASSLTIGHLVQVIRMRLLQEYGHKPIVLVGGATGLIGDPRQTSERKLLKIEESLENAEGLKKQLSKYISFTGDNKALMVNNYDWISKINIIEFLRDYGKNFNISYMLAKETVASRLQSGISYTEFSYMILQAIDWLYLYQTYNCQIQFGGSDQWGNITAGLDLIRKVNGDNSNALGLSSPLLMKSDGQKFGKSESGALWLDKDLTSPYTLYQYLLNTTDTDVITYLKTLTLLAKKTVEDLELSLAKEPEKRLAQKTLAFEVVRFVHGKEEALKVQETSKELFSSLGFSKNMPIVELDEKLLNDCTIIDLLTLSNITSSKSEGRRLVEQGGISLNQERVVDPNLVIKDSEVIIQKGKKVFVKIVFK
ncbi:MAG: tyrosine--tRNA ligase [Tenericutes bacterium]|jgi:tyrosyl-tRNA synthetase|nr:tyrosine--tRNA ligase [Mycoplasmatota bacterium]